MINYYKIMLYSYITRYLYCEMYELVVLVISSNDLAIYAKIRSITASYLRLFSTRVKFFFVEYNNINQDIIEKGDYIYIKGNETGADGIYYKTVKAIEYINKTYQYEYLLRSNVSTFLNIYNIIELLSSLPKTNFAGGHVLNCCYEFPWLGGLCMVFSKDVTDILVNHTKFDHDLHKHDDVIISLVLLENNIPLKPIMSNMSENNVNTYFIVVFENGYLQDQFIPVSQNILCYRIKNFSNRDIFDIQYHKHLLKLVYDIHS